MSHKFKALGLLLLITGFSLLNAQNYSNSPYTRYGIGDLINQGLVYNKSFGGASAAIRKNNQINYLNPASLTSQDTNSFLLQSGMTMRYVRLYNDDFSSWRNNMNLNYLVMGFPIGKYLCASVGLVPYSRVDYHFTQDALADENETLIQEYEGRGGFNEFYIALGGKIYNTLSLGASLNYLFGSFERDRQTYYSDANTATFDINEVYIASDIFFRFGAQLHPTINEKHKPVLGFAYEALRNVKGKADYVTTYSYLVSDDDVLLDVSDSNYTISLPEKFTFGFSYRYNDKFMLTGEYLIQDWSKFKEIDDYFSYRGGISYRHRSLSERTRSGYIEYVEFRLGGHYTNTYVTLADTDILDYGISIGAGFPWKNYRNVFTGTGFNVTYQFGLRGSKENNLLMENYHTLSIGVVLHDYWFYKTKYE